VRTAHPTARPQVFWWLCRCAAPQGPWSLSVDTPAARRLAIIFIRTACWWRRLRRAHHISSWTLPPHRHVGQPTRMNHRLGGLPVGGILWCARRTLPPAHRYHVASVGVLRPWVRGCYLLTPRRPGDWRLFSIRTAGWWRRVRRAHHFLPGRCRHTGMLAKRPG
jgi:hypothetical protein